MPSMASPTTLNRRYLDHFAGRHGNIYAGVDHFRATGQSICGIHGDRPDAIFAQVLLDFQHQNITVGTRYLECTQNFGELGAFLRES